MLLFLISGGFLLRPVILGIVALIERDWVTPFGRWVGPLAMITALLLCFYLPAYAGFRVAAMINPELANIPYKERDTGPPGWFP